MKLWKTQQRLMRSFMAAFALVLTAASTGSAAPQSADPWVVSMGDSAISGEAGRWAGNTNMSPAMIDALGTKAYNDNANRLAEAIPGCHRSLSAEVYIGNGVNGLNLACSGARTDTHFSPDGSFKPGIDFYLDAAGRRGQALALQQFAKTHWVKAVVVLIGANNYEFANIVQKCVTAWALSTTTAPRYCKDDPEMISDFSTVNYVTQIGRVTKALQNIEWAMLNAGYADSQYTIIAQTYSSPVPTGGGFRYPETGLSRQGIGGCGIWNTDANWVNSTVVSIMNNTIKTAASWAGLTNVRILDAQNALVGHRLCENTNGLLEEKGIRSWASPAAADVTEWVQQVRTGSTLFGPYQLQEDGHPNYWGQLALRNCLRQTYEAIVAGNPHRGTCRSVGGLNSRGEPSMTLY